MGRARRAAGRGAGVGVERWPRPGERRLGVGASSGRLESVYPARLAARTGARGCPRYSTAHRRWNLKTTSANADPAELSKFAALAQSWWDPKGPSKPLHDLNPLRLSYVQRIAPLQHKQVLDVGCGGGILSESMARAGAHVLGIDLAQAGLDRSR